MFIVICANKFYDKSKSSSAINMEHSGYVSDLQQKLLITRRTYHFAVKLLMSFFSLSDKEYSSKKYITHNSDGGALNF